MENEANKNELRRIIESEVAIQMNLKDVIRAIEEEVKRKITSTIDNEFIESEYLTHCKEFLTDEVREFVKKLNQTGIQNILTSLREISTLSQFQECFRSLHYYNLLMKHITLISKEDNESYTITLKNLCREQIHLILGNAIKELQFLKCFTDFMSRTYCLPYVLTNTRLLAFCDGELQIDELTSNILKLNFSNPIHQWACLCDSTRELIKQHSVKPLFFLDLIKQVLRPYSIPIKIQEVQQQDSTLLRISGMNIVLSHFKDEIETKLKNNSNIEEVNIVAERIFHIDASLSDKSVWHGKNINCVAKAIQVRESGLEWNVSGMDSVHVYKTDAGRESSGEGKNGADGFAGESGGNISILAEEIISANLLTITSYGGNGSKGQDGGNGADGADGKSIGFNSFKDRFPTTSFFLGSKTGRNYYKTMGALRSDCANREIWSIAENEDTYVQGTTSNGNQITYSDTSRRWFTKRQSFLLYKGSYGSAGRSGGQPGLGGEGGYAGEISIQVQGNGNSSTDDNCIQRAKQGENGEDGKGGLYGKFGQNGWDVAWMDYEWTGWPKYYGVDENSTLKVEFYNGNSSNRVFCPYKENSAYKYAEIKASNLEHAKIKKFDERQSSKRERTELQQQSQAVRQKAISGQTMKAEFSKIQQMDSKSSIYNLQSEIQTLHDAALQEIVVTEAQELTQSFQIKVIRNTRYEGKKTSRQKQPFINTRPNIKNMDNSDPLRILEEQEKVLKSEDHVGSIDELLRKNSTEILTKLEMCRLFLYRQIDKKLPVYYRENQAHSIISLNARSASRYLVKANEDISESILHRTLGTLRQYFCFDDQTRREKIAKFCKQIQKDKKAKSIIKSSIREFVLEAGNAEIAHRDLKKFHDLYNFHLNRQANGFIAFPDAIDEYCLDDNNVYQSFVKYLVDHGCESSIYLNLLANIFKVNLRVYFERETNDFELQLSFNPSAKVILYVSHKFERLTLNDCHQQLIAERHRRCLQYQKIIMDVQKFHTSSQFQNYFASKNFLNKNHYSEYEIEQFYQLHYSKETDAVHAIAENFPKNVELQKRLPKLAFFFSGQRGIIYFLQQHFAHEAIRVSASELDYIINYALNYACDNGQNDTELFLTWIIAAHNQENWIDEVILLELEEYFGKQLPNKQDWRNFLSEIGNKNILICLGQQLAKCDRNSLTMECVQEILYLLSKVPNQEVNVDELDLPQWSYVLRSVYWTFELSKIAHWANDQDLERLCYYVEIIKNIFGHHFTSQLLRALKRKVERREDVIVLSQRGILNDLMNKISSQTWMITENHLKRLEAIGLEAWFNEMTTIFAAGMKERSLRELTNIIRRNANTSESILSIVSQVEKAICTPDYRHAKKLEEIDNVIMQKRKYRLRDTQKLAVLLLLKNERSTLAQVSTGEGKTLIVVSVALIKALNGEKVDIVTSSSVLAKRDADINSDIYKHFKVGVSHNCSEEIEGRKTAYSSKVVYGELSNFQRDYLLDSFYGKNILGKRNFSQVNVIVDEVDSMLLDKGNNMLYLSHDLPGMDKLESVYIFIWTWICKPAEPADCFNDAAIREAVLRDLYGLITIADISQIDPRLSKLQVSKLWNSLVDGNIVDKMGKLKVNQVNKVMLKKILSSEFSVYSDRLLYLITDCVQRQRRIHLPNYLRAFVERHLDTWIQSAFYAFFMAESVDYVVDVDRTGAASSSRSPQIIILDKGTGTDQTSSQWDEGLHQFLQLKHNCKITLQSLKAVFTSNVSFFKLYKNLYGLTGTLGSQVERDILTQMHGVDFFTVPTAKVKQLEEFPPVVCPDSNEWVKLIQNETNKLTQGGRSVLIIAETVKDAEELHNTIRGKARLYTREFNEFDIVKGTEHLSTGEVIIATNLAGRGTDIKISNELKEAGGLHVILTYLPSNVRIEEQAFGRTARCGEKGTAQLIIIDSASGGRSKRRSNIFRLKNQRNEEEVRRLSEVKIYYENQILLEESCFKEFHETYKTLKGSISSPDFFLKLFVYTPKQVVNNVKAFVTDNESEKFVDPEFSAILLDAVLEKWAFWLDLNSKLIQDCPDKTIRKKVLEKLNDFNSDLRKLPFSSSNEWVRESPIQTVKLGLYMANKISLREDAIQLFNRVIETEPSFSDAAHYYKAFVLIKDQKINEFKKELRATMRLLNQHSVSAQLSGAIVDTLKLENKQSILQIDAYKQQQAAFAHIYELILDSIRGVFGYPVTVTSLRDNNIQTDRAFDIFRKLIERGVLTKPKVEAYEEETVKKIAVDYGSNDLKNYLFEIQNRSFESEHSFRQSLKRHIILPSREHFFRNLVKQKVLNNETKLVAFEIQNLKSIDSELGCKVEKLLSKKELGLVNVSSSDIWLSATKPNSEHTLVERQSFREAVGTKWYTILKQTNSVTFHYKAKVNEDRMNSVQFSHFDSICVSDFKEVNISEVDAAKIMDGLVKNGILVQRSNDCPVYSLRTTFKNMSNAVLVPEIPVYENATHNLLRKCFLYRKEYERLKTELAEKSSPINLGIFSKPYNSLIRDLVLEGILVPTKVSEKSVEEIEEILNNILPKPSKWEIGKSYLQSNPNLDEKYPDKELNIVILNLLSSSKATLESLETPDVALKPLGNMCTKENLGMAEEFYRFSLNGFEQLVELTEKKWTLAWVKRSALVFAIGLSQTVLGAVLQLVPILGNVGGTFLLEQGVGDLMFVAYSACSGHLTWGDYKQHKIFSCIISGITFGIGACFGGASKVSVYGQKLAAPGLQQSGKEIFKMSGKRLVNAVGKKAIANAVAKNIVKSARVGIANGVWNYSVSCVIETSLRDFCNHTFEDASIACCAKIDENNATEIFEEIHKKNGTKNSKKFVENAINVYFTNKKNDREFFVKTMEIIEVFRKSFHSIAKQKKKGTLALNFVKVAIFTTEKVTIIALIVQLVESFLDYLKSECKKQPASEKTQQPSVKFKEDVSAMTKERFQKEIQNIFFEKIASPIVNMGLNAFKDYAINKVGDIYQKRKDFNELEKAKKEFEIDSKTQLRTPQRDQLKKTYEEKLLKLMSKTRSPDVVAAIVREGISMNMTCVMAAANLVADTVKCPVKIAVNAHDKLQQEVTSDGEIGKEPLNICINLNENHYTSGIDDDESSHGPTNGNDCLYESLPQKFRERMSAAQFRNKIADEIARNPKIRNYIKNGYHRLPRQLNLYGGRKAVNPIRNEESTENDIEGNPRYEANTKIKCRIIKNGKQVHEPPTKKEVHLIDRFVRLKELYDLLNKISNSTGIPMGEIIQAGGSVYQDARSNDINYHKAHVIQMGKINSEMDKYPEWKKQLKELIGHTQLVDRNVNYGVGRLIDTFQAQNHQPICQSGGFEKRFNEMRRNFVSLLDKSSNLPCYKDKPEVINAIQVAKSYIETYEFSNSNRRNSIN